MKLRKLFGIVFISLMLTGCQDDQDDNLSNFNQEGNQNDDQEGIKDFIWKAMNIFYVYKSDSPDLADDRFETTPEYRDFLASIETPINFFYSLLAQQDRFSFIVEDFEILEQRFNGISLNNGMKFGLVRFNDTDFVFGYVRYVVPDSPADVAGVERGMIFNRVDGVVFTPETDFNQLFAPNNYTIGLAEIQDMSLIPLEETIPLSKVQLTENPILEQRVIDVNGQQVGYLMYNNFRSNYDTELNAVFANFQAKGVTDLVLDLRYNSGGRIETAKDLSSMITGQFNEQVFAQQIYNSNFDPSNIFFDNQISTEENINSLNLNRVFILTTSSSASASELVINALNPYIDVVQIGRTTAGKFEGSVTLYDSEDFRRANANLDHKYAIQPLILKTANKEGFTGFFDGLEPDILQNEDFANLGILGNPNETLLNRALQEIDPDFVPDPERRALNIPKFQLLGEDDMNAPPFNGCMLMKLNFKNLFKT